MARSGCKCRDGSYRTKCCTSTKRSSKAQKTKRSNKKSRRRDGGRDGHPLQVVLDRLERRGKRYAYGSIIAGGLYGVALVAETTGEVYGEMQAYGQMAKPVRSYPKPIRGKVAKRYARRQAVARTAYTAGKITSRVVVRGVPIIGTALLVYDLYTVTDYLLGGRLPYGARDRR